MTIRKMKTWQRLLLVLVTVGGGFTGILAIVPLLGGAGGQGLRYAMIVIVSLAGLLFVYDANLTRPMLFAFVLQVPWVDLPGLRYQLYSAAYTAITFGPHSNGRIGIGLSADLGTHVEFRIGGLPEGAWSVGGNLFALLVALFLLKSCRTSDASAIVGLESQSPAPSA
jgi:hypothetical protein